MDTVKVPACVQRAEVRPEVSLLVAVLWVLSESKYTNVARAHQVDPDGLEAVVWERTVSAHQLIRVYMIKFTHRRGP